MLILIRDHPRQCFEVTIGQGDKVAFSGAHWPDGRPYMVVTGTDVFGNIARLTLSSANAVILENAAGLVREAAVRYGDLPCEPSTAAPPTTAKAPDSATGGSSG